ncbi:MAG TPA: helix-hairpin-helix domain-containing protein [Candidatus Paceibacterota bacterium]|nr:helix-hairpin-helix domain-containing protein [Candidatus Paceibacterota bacterium]
MRKALVVLILSFFTLPALASAALVNINTADEATLDGLPYLTPTVAQAVIDYRTANGPFARIEDIQNVTGIKSGIFAHIHPLITVGDAGTAVPEASTTEQAASSTSSSAGDIATYTPPTALSVAASGNEMALLEVPLRLSARVTAKSGSLDTAARILWSFGDGSSGEGSAVEKTYRYPGTYLVVATATDGPAEAQDDITVTVKPAPARIAAITGDGITLANDSADERLDLSAWRLTADAGSFRIPEGTMLLPNASVLFPQAVTNLPVSFGTTLSYPDGIIAARYAVPATAPDVQPPSPDASYESVQAVEPITSPRTLVQSYEEAALAPAAVPNEGTAAGAPLPDVPAAPIAAAGAAPAAHSLFTSPWTLGFAGVMTLAAGAFILL